jgi:AraC-like DNA-binding protein
MFEWCVTEYVNGGGMYSSRTVEANDPDLFASSIRPIGDFIVIERGSFKARSILFDLGRVYAQRVHERLARVRHAELSRGGVLFLTDPGPSMFMNGAEIGMDQIAVVGPGESYTSRLSGSTRWGAVTLAKEDLENLCIHEAGRCLNQISGVTVFMPRPEALVRLRSLHKYLGRIVETTPELLSDIGLTHYLENRLIEVIQEILKTQTSGPNTTGKFHHQIIINRFREVLEAQANEPLQMPQISQKIGVSSRTLRLACQEQLGVSPSRYILLRRMRSARRALQKADPDVTLVTNIATEFGFYELGRFAVAYRNIFGESPSATLRGVV